MEQDKFIVDQRWPHKGPCIFCQNPDARHRIFDAIFESHSEGDSIEILSINYNASKEQIEAVIAICQDNLSLEELASEAQKYDLGY